MNMMNQGHYDAKRDLSPNREVILDNGNKYHVHQKVECPFGYWYIHMDKGQIPDELRGAFTSPTVAYAAINSYLQTSKSRRTVVQVKEK
jgi:hypothetical protein